MRVSLSTNLMSCQPLRFGKAEPAAKESSVQNPGFSSSTVSREEYNKLQSKYELACRIAVAQAEQYKKYVAAHPDKN